MAILTPMIVFTRVERLWWLVLVVIMLLLYVALLSRSRTRVRRGGLSKLEQVMPRRASWKRHLAVGSALLSMASLNVAYAEPMDEVMVPQERATVVIVMDVSRSMMALDVQPNRLDAAKSSAKQFAGMLPKGFNLALVSFAGTASLVVPPTQDRGLVTRSIDNLELAPSTAIGEGIYTALDAVALAPRDPDDPDDVAPAAIVLLSDGYTNIGRPSLNAAREAKNQNIPVYTIAYGTEDGYVETGGRREPVPVNHTELIRIAQASGGEKFSASSLDELKKVYQSIARKVGYVLEYREVTELYAGIALFFAVLATIGVMSLATRWP